MTVTQPVVIAISENSLHCVCNAVKKSLKFNSKLALAPTIVYKFYCTDTAESIITSLI